MYMQQREHVYMYTCLYVHITLLIWSPGRILVEQGHKTCREAPNR